MPTTIDESVFKKLFSAYQLDAVTTQAKIWVDPTGIKTVPTVFVPGENTLVIGGKSQVFKDGAFVYSTNGEIKALPGSVTAGGGITVDGGPVSPVTVHYSTNRPVGNMATLKFNEGTTPGTSTLSLRMPEGRGAGFLIRYPAHTQEELIKIADSEGAVVKVKDAEGKVLEGFFPKGSGGAVPDELGPYASSTNFNEGDFVSITRRPDGRSSLFTYRTYTPEQMNQATNHGQYSKPGNNVDQLRTLEGEPIKPGEFPRLNFQADGGNKILPESKGWFGKAAEAPGGAPPTVPELPDGTPPVQGPKLPTPKLDTTPPVAEGASAVGKVTRYLAPAALAITPIFEGISEGYTDYQKNHSLLDGAGGVAVGAAKGVVDTILPGARDGYSDVVGGGDKTFLDRALNAASDFTGTATAVGSVALVAETAGVVSIPATIPTGIATLAAGITNLGINAAKGALKVTGLAGADQDGGYIYEGGKAAIHGVEHLFGYDTPPPAPPAESATRRLVAFGHGRRTPAQTKRLIK